MNIDVRTAAPEEQQRAIEACEQAFGWDVPEEEMGSLLALVEPDRTFIATSGDEIVGAGANFSFEMSVPGGSAPVAGLTLVGVLPTHRRRGALRKLMQKFLADPLERNESMSVLWASESAIYQRFGYGMASVHMQIEAERSRMSFLDDTEPTGQVKFLSVEEAVKVLPSVYDRARASTPGMMSRTEDWWMNHRLRDPERARDGGGPMWRAALEIDGIPEAYALYRVHGDWPDGNPRGKLQALEVISTDALSTREMWRFLFGVDLIETVKCDFMPIDHPLLLMLSDPRRMKKRFGDSLWVRIVDVPGALSARSYSTADVVTVQVADDLLDDVAGTWRIDTTGDNVSVTRSEDPADLSMHVRDLGAVYLGGHTTHQLARAGRVTGAPEAMTRLDAMLATTRAPWCPEIF